MVSGLLTFRNGNYLKSENHRTSTPLQVFVFR